MVSIERTAGLAAGSFWSQSSSSADRDADYVDEEYSQHASNAGQDGLHLFKSLGG